MVAGRQVDRLSLGGAAWSLGGAGGGRRRRARSRSSDRRRRGRRTGSNWRFDRTRHLRWRSRTGRATANRRSGRWRRTAPICSRSRSREIPPGQHADPSWSPDGKRVIFASLAIITMGFRGALFTVDVKSGEASSRFRWARSGRRRTRCSRRTARASTSRVGRSSRARTACTTPRSRTTQRAVELCRTKQAVPARIAVSRDGKIAGLHADGQRQPDLAHGDRREATPAPFIRIPVVRARVPNFSPDGTRISFQVQSDDSTLGIWMMNADGSQRRRAWRRTLATATARAGRRTGRRWLLQSSSGATAALRALVNLTDGSRQDAAGNQYDMLRGSHDAGRAGFHLRFRAGRAISGSGRWRAGRPSNSRSAGSARGSRKSPGTASGSCTR